MLRRFARASLAPPSTSRAVSSSKDVVRSPSPWRPVRDERTGEVYWWNTRTNETTAVGAPRPRSDALVDDPNHRITGGGGRETFGQAISGSFFMGAGVALGFGAIGALFRMF